MNDGHNPSGYGQVLEEHRGGAATPTMTYILGNSVVGQADASGAAGYLLADARGVVNEREQLFAQLDSGHDHHLTIALQNDPSRRLIQ